MAEAALIKTILRKNMSRYSKGISESDAFEFFTAETVLKRYGLTFDEIEDGIVDGQDDGGIDSVYMFVNRALVATDTDMDTFKAPVEVDIYVIQSKYENGFKESSLAKLVTALPQLMALSPDEAALKVIYNEDVLEKFAMYREKLLELAGEFPTVRMHVIYVTIAHAGNEKCDAMLPGLQKEVKKLTNPPIWTDSYLPELRRRGGADFRISQLRGRDASAKGSS